MALGTSTLGTIPLGDTEPFLPPAVAGSRIAGTPIAGADNAVFGRGLGFADLPGLPDTPGDLAVPSPVLQFYELVTATATTRVVDFADPEASATPGQVTFDGKEWTSVRLGKPTIEQGLDGRSPSITLQVADPTRSIAQFVRANNKLRGAVVNLWLIEWRHIATPSLAKTYRFLVQRTQCIEGPPRVAITVASPSLHDLGYPKAPISRLVCQNPFHRRFTFDTRNLCSYPSDEFAYQTQQVLEDTVDTEVEKFFGWFVVNGSKPATWKVAQDTPFITVPRFLCSTTFSAGSPEIWEDATRTGPYCYKKILSQAGSDTDVDVHSLCNVTLTNGIGGLLVQSAADPSTWILWGSRIITGTQDLISRVTTAGTSVDTVVAEPDEALRIERSGNTWKLYSQNITQFNKSVITGGWTLRRTETLAITGDIHVGIVTSASVAATGQSLAIESYYIRFAAGGFTTCDKTLSDCTERKNTVQRNAFLSLPDVARTF